MGEFKSIEIENMVFPITVHFEKPQKFNAAIEGNFIPFATDGQSFVNYINTETKIAKGTIIEGETNDA
jgi:hypothetical protein